MNKYYLIDLKATKEYLSEKTKQDPERTIWSLDFLIKNIDNNLLNALSDNKLMIELDNQKKEVTLLGDEMPADVWEVLFDKKVTPETIYNSIVRACEVAQKIDWWEKLIKEIKSDEKSLEITP